MAEYLTEKEVSRITKRSISTLRKDRHYGGGLPYIKNSRQILYVREIIDKHLMQNLVTPRNDTGRKAI